MPFFGTDRSRSGADYTEHFRGTEAEERPYLTAFRSPEPGQKEAVYLCRNTGHKQKTQYNSPPKGRGIILAEMCRAAYREAAENFW